VNPVTLRHKLHTIPELAFEEHKTRALLLESLNALELDQNWSIHQFSTNTGVLVEFRGFEVDGSRSPMGSFKLFRADMDALPSHEQTGCSFASQHPGLMHACGHDVHMSVLMGLIAKVAIEKPKRNLLFLFQPAEEGKGGAQSILGEGLIQSFKVDSAIALHVASEMPVGTISSKPGIFFGIPQEFDVVFKGKAAHVAFPEKGINALQAGVEFMNAIQASVTALAKSERVLFNIGKVASGIIRNVIPAECRLEGTHRSLSRQARDTLNGFVKEIATEVAAKTGAEAEVDFLCSYDPVINDTALVNELKATCHKLGYSYLEAETAMTGEDFGFFTTLYPGLLFWLGSGCDKPLHSEKFLPDDSCIEVGIATLFGLI